MSEHARKVLDDSRLVILSGIAGGGRNTIINYLVEHFDYTFLVSDTTRPPKLRDGVMEQHGVNYFFRKEAEMLADIQNGEFVEAEVIHNQQVSGTSIRELEKANQSGKIVLHEIEFGGVHNLAEAKPDADIIGVLPPNYNEWIRRFNKREVIHEQEFRNRLVTARKVLISMIEQPYFKFVINDSVERAAESIRLIAESGVYSEETHAHGQNVARELLQRVDETLGVG